jgi:hypothetical protein
MLWSYSVVCFALLTGQAGNPPQVQADPAMQVDAIFAK